MIRIHQIKVPAKHSRADIERKIQKALRLSEEQAFTFQIRKESIDARKKQAVSYVYTVDVDLDEANHAMEEELVQKIHNKNIMLTKESKYRFPKAGADRLSYRPVIVGSGPAGLFCAYLLALYGYAPIILERGKQASERFADVTAFWQDGVLEPSSNVQFGEGGAGTFSDGKLNTLVKDPLGRNRFVLETLVSCGADSNILYVNKPHVGTDRLIQVVQNLREEIIRMGGTFSFETCLTDIRTEDGRICSITASHNGQSEQIPADLLVLAIGHSARDTFEMLHQNGLTMEAKPFAVGLRIEHPQEMISTHQYKGADLRYLPPASYKVTANTNGRGVYSFCTCPGGYVVNASSEPQRLAVNGMSYQKRDGSNCNSAVIVSVTPQDFQDFGDGPLCGIAFQRELETRAFALCQGNIPQQLYGDYKTGKISSGYGSFSSQAKGACAIADLSGLLPDPVREALINGIERFGGYIPDFNRYDAVLSGVESRTSSPVRILRGDTFESSVRGIYPCGEGAGYAGGIMSAAMDGIKTAEAVRSCFKPF